MLGARGAVALLVMLGAAPTLSACRRSERPRPAPSTPTAAPRAAASTAPPARPSAPPVVHGCRVLGVKGRTPPPEGTPAVGTLLHGTAWLELARGVELDLKHTETTRELRLMGPGRFLACAAGAESVVVARGSVATTSGPGSRAGAEVELATPFGVIHYADAVLRLDVNEQALELAVTQGSASVEARAGDERDGGAAPEPVRAPKGRLSLRGQVDTAALLARCAEAHARVAGPPASSVPSARPERGAWAVGLLQARKAARQSCARARAAVGRADGAERDRLEDQLSVALTADTAFDRPSPSVPGSAAGK